MITGHLSRFLRGGRTGVLDLIEIVPSATLNGAYGAFSRDTNKIYLASEYVTSSSVTSLSKLLLEEYGHYIDAQLNSVETIGDEGEIFADLVQGNAIDPAVFTEDDTEIINVNGNWINVEQAAGVFAEVFNPVGITVGSNGNVTVDNGEAIGQFDSDGTLEEVQNATGGFGYLVTIPSSSEILKLSEGGRLYKINPRTLRSSSILDLKSLNNINISSIFDITTGTTNDFGGLILLNAAQTFYGDISVLERGEQIDLFISGISVITPFVMRLRFQNDISSQFLTDARVIVASRGTTAGSSNLNRGVAVNQQGIVLTTLPIVVGINSPLPTFIDVPVSFSADFSEGNGAIPQVRLQGQGVNFIDGQNHVDIRSRGMAVDAAGNFHIVTNSNPGSIALTATHALIVLSPTVDRVLDVQTGGGFISEFRDVAVAPDISQAYATSSTDQIINFSLNLPVVPLPPPPDFNPAQYGASYSDLIINIGYNLDVLIQHYINNGRAEGRSIDNFDEYRYIASNSDLLNAFGANGAGATEHYIRYGYGEGRPTTAFDSARYLLSNTDLLNAYGTHVLSASYHYVAYGSKPPENRNPNAFPSDRYIASNPDLLRAFGYNLVAGSEHYLYRVYTGAESRPINFSPENYLALNSDVAAHPYFGQSLTNATQHYILYGFSEGRSWI